MCGIVAYFKAQGLRREDIRRGMKATRALAHRGPDGEGMLLINVETCEQVFLHSDQAPAGWEEGRLPQDIEEGKYHLLLGHRRLSIFDLSIDGHQPLKDPQGNAIIFNGEIYNWPEIRAELQQKGHSFKTQTDTEVILAAYREYGPECIKQFNGMWSMVLWDNERRKIFVTNDRIGIKQIYYTGKGEDWGLGSEFKAIHALGITSFHIDKDHGKDYLISGLVDSDSSTFLEEVKKFPPAHLFTGEPKQFHPSRFKRYWAPRLGGDSKLMREEAVSQLADLIDDSLNLRMRADVPWATTLSGGLDSSVIVYAATRLRKEMGLEEPIRTFSAVFPGRFGDESEHIEFIENDLGIQAEYIHPYKEFSFEDFSGFLRSLDFPVPTASMYAQYCVMRRVGSSPIKVLLDGQGADELFGGYHHHFYAYARQLYLKGKFKRANRAIRQWAERKGEDPKEVKSVILNEVKLYLKLKLKGDRDLPAAVSEQIRSRNLAKTCYMDLTSTILPSLLRFEDRSSMSFGIEARVPFLDYRIIEFAYSLPPEYLIFEGWQKHVLRLAAQDLPDRIRWRADKKGFTVPQNDWIDQYWKEFSQAADQVKHLGMDLGPSFNQVDKLPRMQLFRAATLNFWMEELQVS